MKIYTTVHNGLTAHLNTHYYKTPIANRCRYNNFENKIDLNYLFKT